MEKAPGKRYESAEALTADLARWAAGQPILARAVGSTERAVRWARRNPAVSGLSAAVLLVAVTGVAGIVWNWRHATANATKAEVAATSAREAAKKERWERYRVCMVAASSALRLEDTNAARGALDDAPEEHRDWVWNLLRAQLDKSQHVLRGHSPINGGRALTPDGRWVFSHGMDNSLHVWDTHTRTQFEPIARAHAGRLALSPDGATIAQAESDNTITFSADGARLLSGSGDKTLRVWDAGRPADRR